MLLLLDDWPLRRLDLAAVLDSMASGHAEQGRAAQAVGTASFAIAFAEETGETETAAAIRARLPAPRGER